MFQIWFFDFKGNILDVRARIVTNRFCWIRLHFTRRGGDKRKTRWRNGMEENDYFKYFRQTGAINLGAAIIRGNTVHCEARLTYPVFILILALVEKKKKITVQFSLCRHSIRMVKNFWVSFAVYCDIVLRALFPSIAIKIWRVSAFSSNRKRSRS